MKTNIKNDFLAVEILHRGAELCSISKNNKEYIWNGNSNFWGKHSPILFPIVGALSGNEYEIDNIKYQMNRHGFARDHDFDLFSIKEHEAIFILKSSLNTLNIYPFDFEFKIRYQLIDSAVVVSYEITNKSNLQMPFSIGAHPAFAVVENFENYKLLFSEQETLDCFELENDLLTNNFYKIELDEKCLSLQYNLFANDALIFKKLNSKQVTILENDIPMLAISFNDFTSLGIWTKIGAPFICIEPWLGYADIVDSEPDFFKKEGIQIIDEACSFNCSYTISIL